MPLLALTVLFACHPARMAVSPELVERTVAYEVRGRGEFVVDERFSFGPLHVDSVKRSWTHATVRHLEVYQGLFLFTNDVWMNIIHFGVLRQRIPFT